MKLFVSPRRAARVCMQTGLYATQAGVWRNGTTPPARLRTLAHHFNEACYHTDCIGKWCLAPCEPRGVVPPEFRDGYQSWHAVNVLESVSDADDTHLWDERGREHKLPGYRVDAMTDATIRHLAAHQRDPFFLSYLDPHHQNHCDHDPAPQGCARALLRRRGSRRTLPRFTTPCRSTGPATAAW